MYVRRRRPCRSCRQHRRPGGEGLENSRSTLITGMPASIALVATSVRAAPSNGSSTIASTLSLMKRLDLADLQAGVVGALGDHQLDVGVLLGLVLGGVVIAAIQPWSAAGAEKPIVTFLPVSSWRPPPPAAATRTARCGLGRCWCSAAASHRPERGDAAHGQAAVRGACDFGEGSGWVMAAVGMSLASASGGPAESRGQGDVLRVAKRC